MLRKIVKKKSRRNMFGYKILYSDSKLLSDKNLNLSGKPDYIFKNKFTGRLVPAELKSGAASLLDVPKHGDLMQLVCYFVLTEKCLGSRPKKGRLIYNDFMFIIKNTRRLRNELFSTISDMRRMIKTGKHDVSPTFPICKHCVCQGTVCEHCSF